MTAPSPPRTELPGARTGTGERMALSEKWEALMGPGTGDAGTGMTPASAAPPGGGGPEGQADLKVMHGPWTTASGVAGELHTPSIGWTWTPAGTATTGIASP